MKSVSYFAVGDENNSKSEKYYWQFFFTNMKKLAFTFDLVMGVSVKKNVSPERHFIVRNIEIVASSNQAVHRIRQRIRII